jgi:hypothetical protein
MLRIYRLGVLHYLLESFVHNYTNLLSVISKLGSLSLAGSLLGLTPRLIRGCPLAARLPHLLTATRCDALPFIVNVFI